MRIEHEQRDGAWVVRLAGDTVLDAASAKQVREGILALLDRAPAIVVDLESVAFLDSAGVGVLVSVFKRARLARRRLVFTGLQPEVRRVLDLVRLTEILEVRPDLAGALRAAQRGASTQA